MKLRKTQASNPVEAAAAAAAKSLQSCPTLCDPIDSSPPGSPVPGILQARTLEWVAISFSNAWKWKVKVKSLSRVQLFVTPQTAAYQAPPTMAFSRREYWSGLPLPSPAEDNMVIHKQHKLIEKVKDELVTISEWLKWGYTHHKNVQKQNFVHSTEYDKSRTFKEVIQRIQQADGRGKQLISHVTFTEYFSNFGRAAPDFVHLVSGLTETNIHGAPTSYALVVHYHIVKHLCKWAYSWFSSLSLNPGLTSGFQLPTQWNKTFKPRSQVWHDLKTHTGHFLPN